MSFFPEILFPFLLPFLHLPLAHASIILYLFCSLCVCCVCVCACRAYSWGVCVGTSGSLDEKL